MSDTPPLVVCFSTVSTIEQAQQLASQLIERCVAACVQIDGPIQSYYQWEGKPCCEPEYRLIIKSSSDAAAKLQETLRELHPYEVPQIVLLESVAASREYAAWVCEQVRG